MNRTVGITLGLAIILAISSLSCQQEQESEQARQVISVKSELIRLSDLELTKKYTGSLEGEKQATIYARLSEAVEKVHVSEGEEVKAGQVLVSLDKYGSTSRYSETLSLYRNAEKNHEKMAYLFKEGAISESQYDAAKTEFEVNKASFEAVSRMVDVQSPISGVVTAINVSEGEYVAVGQKLATVAATDKLRVKLSVNPDEVSLFDIGSQVTVHADAAGDAARGRVVAIASSADPVTRAFEIEALIDNSQGHFRPGMFVTVDFIQENLEDVIVVPRPAVLNLDDRWSVFVVENGVARKRLVELGSEVDGHIVIKSGLAVGDTLVVLGQDYIEDGFAVNVSSLDEGV